MTIELSRRAFLQTAGAGLAGTTLGAFGFGDIEAAHAAAIRPFKLANTTETRNTCTYCSVACGIIMYSKGDLKKGEKAEIIHIEGDADHPTNRGTLVPEGRGAPQHRAFRTRLTHPMVRKPGTDSFEPISWDEALDKIARVMKDDRDENFIARNEAGVTGQPLDHAPASSPPPRPPTRPPSLTYKVVRSAGMLVVRQPSKGLTRPNGGQFWPQHSAVAR